MGLLFIPARAEEEQTALGKQMEAMDDAYKGFRRETDAAKGAKEAQIAQNAVLKAATEIPALIKEMPDGPEKDKAVNEYRTMMGKLFVSLCEVETAFLAGKIDEVAKIVDNLKEMKKSGHKKFVKEDE